MRPTYLDEHRPPTVAALVAVGTLLGLASALLGVVRWVLRR